MSYADLRRQLAYCGSTGENCLLVWIRICEWGCTSYGRVVSKVERFLSWQQHFLDVVIVTSELRYLGSKVAFFLELDTARAWRCGCIGRRWRLHRLVAALCAYQWSGRHVTSSRAPIEYILRLQTLTSSTQAHITYLLISTPHQFPRSPSWHTHSGS